MLVLKEFVQNMLLYTIYAYQWVMIIYLLAGWFINNRYAGWYVFMGELVEPPLRFARRITRNRLVIENIDLSPLLVFFGLYLLSILVNALFTMI